MIKKLYSLVFICIFLMTSCTANNSTVQKQITHVRFFDDFIRIQIDDHSYYLESKDQKTVQSFRTFYNNYHNKVSKQALNLQILTRDSMEFTYSLFIDKSLLSKDEIIQLEKQYQAKELHQNKYIMISFLADAKTSYRSDNEDEYKLQQPIPIIVTDKRTFQNTDGGQLLLMLTIPVWVPFALVFGLKP